MKARKNHKTDRAARKLATLFENYVSKLLPAEQEARYQAFERAVNRACARRAKSSKRPATRASRAKAPAGAICPDPVGRINQ